MVQARTRKRRRTLVPAIVPEVESTSDKITEAAEAVEKQTADGICRLFQAENQGPNFGLAEDANIPDNDEDDGGGDSSDNLNEETRPRASAAEIEVIGNKVQGPCTNSSTNK